jgi:hypothetical protein
MQALISSELSRFYFCTVHWKVLIAVRKYCSSTDTLRLLSKMPAHFRVVQYCIFLHVGQTSNLNKLATVEYHIRRNKKYRKEIVVESLIS